MKNTLDTIYNHLITTNIFKESDLQYLMARVDVFSLKRDLIEMSFENNSIKVSLQFIFKGERARLILSVNDSTTQYDYSNIEETLKGLTELSKSFS